MKKVIIAICCTLSFLSCDGITDEIVDSSQSNLKIVDIQAPSEIIYTDENTALTASVEIANGESVSKMWMEIEAVSGAFQLVDNLEMKDDGDTQNSGDQTAGDNIFTGRFFLSDQDPSDSYSVNYYYSDSDDEVKKIGSSNFKYFTGIELEIIEINAPTEITYSGSNTMFKASVEVNTSYLIKDIWCQIKSSDATLTVTDSLQMKDDGDKDNSGDEIAGDNIFTAQYPLSIQVPTDDYTVKYFVKNFQDVIEEVGSTAFIYNNTQFNYPPVLSNLNMVSSIDRDVTFVFSVQADDPNGNDDIQAVYFQLYRPDGSQVFDTRTQPPTPYFLMADNGDVDVYGDEIAGDDIYSFKNKFDTTAAVGNWTFYFQAIDRSDETSEEIEHILEVK
jgi:hypothetical protein